MRQSIKVFSLILAVIFVVVLLSACDFNINTNIKDNSTKDTTKSSQTETQSNKVETEDTKKETEETTPEEKLSFIIYEGELGDYGESVVLNAGSEFEENEIAYHIPAGKYKVINQDTSAAQISVYSGGPEYDGEWQYFVADENCPSPLVVMAGNTAELEIKEGQFIVLSDDSNNIKFILQ